MKNYLTKKVGLGIASGLVSLISGCVDMNLINAAIEVGIEEMFYGEAHPDEGVITRGGRTYRYKVERTPSSAEHELNRAE